MYFVSIGYTFSILEIYNLTSFFRVEILIQIHIYIYIIYYYKASYARERHEKSIDIRLRCVANFLESALQITYRFHVSSPPCENKSMEMRTIIPTRFPSRGWILRVDSLPSFDNTVTNTVSDRWSSEDLSNTIFYHIYIPGRFEIVAQIIESRVRDRYATC